MAVAQVGTLNTFVSGAVAVAADVNSNFTDLKSAFNNLVTGANALNVDTIAEVTAAGGVTVDGLLIKDGSIVAALGIVGTGALNAGSITSGFGAIDVGSSTITTTGTGALGSLTVTSANPTLTMTASGAGAQSQIQFIDELSVTQYSFGYRDTDTSLRIGTTDLVTGVGMVYNGTEFNLQAKNISTTGTASVGILAVTNTDQVGIAVTAAAIHAALVNVGIIT